MIAYQTVFDGVRFVEGRPANATVIKAVRAEIGGILASAQLKNLDDVKRIMAQRAKEVGGNAIIGFKYGQKSVGFFASILQRDDVNWYGEGEIAVLT